jgi:hypothetical protein
MTPEVRSRVAFAAVPLLVEPLRDILDEWDLGAFRAYCYDTIVAALAAYDDALANEGRSRRAGPPRPRPPSPPSAN